MKLRLANPSHLIDINDLSELAFIREQEGEIRIGALTRHVDLLKSDLLAEPHDTEYVHLTEAEWSVLTALKREFASDELTRAAARAGAIVSAT